MGFLDKLLGRAKDTAGDVSDKAAPVVDKAQESAGQAWDKATDVAGDAADKVEDAVSGVTAGARGGFGIVVGVDRGVGADTLHQAGADVVVTDLAELLSTSGPSS